MVTLKMAGTLRDCVLLAYRTPLASVRGLVAAPLELVTHEGWAFWNIVACRVEQLRPLGMPRFLGTSYIHVAYRLCVRARMSDGKSLEGLYFVRSDVDDLTTALLGNIFTDFRFNYSQIRFDASASDLCLRVESRRHLADAVLHACPAQAHEPASSCFATLEQAARVFRYRPIGLSCTRSTQHVKLAEVFRDESRWWESPLRVIEARWNLLDHLNQRHAQLELATRVEPISYVWHVGRRVPVVAPAQPKSTIA